MSGTNLSMTGQQIIRYLRMSVLGLSEVVQLFFIFL